MLSTKKINIVYLLSIKFITMKFYYTYIVKCIDNSYYTGITNNLERRIYEHNADKISNAYTFKRRPVVLVWFESFTDVNLAIITEKKIKGWSKKKKEALINEDWDKLIRFSKNYTEYGKSSTGSD